MSVLGSSATLPQPVIFSHHETLHAIPLPPLASFLVSLHKAEHLSKLNDILDRYRTPKSYHRVDVRVVESSELPPGTPQSFTGRDRLGSREPIELDAGVGLAGYMAEHPELARTVEAQPSGAEPDESADVATTTPALADGEDASKANHQANGEEAPNWLESDTAPSEPTAQNATIAPSPEILNQIVVDPTKPFRRLVSRRSISQTPKTNPPASAVTDQPPSSPLDQIEYTPVKPPLEPAEDRPPSPTPAHPLPPTGPRRKVRELRLDLRTLDAAALFALETWRRQEMGLGSMEIEVPDSVWYKDPTPSPSPPPISLPKKRGRLRKATIPEPIVLQVDESDERLGLDGEEALVPEATMTESQVKGYESLVDAMRSNSDIIKTPDPEQLSIELPDILENIGEAAQQPSPTGVEATTTQTEGDVQVTTVGENMPPELPALERPVTPPPVDTPSPDVVLNDAFNERDDDDPDFVPPASPTIRSVRPRKSAQSGTLDPIASGDGAPTSGRRRGRPPKTARMVSFDLPSFDIPLPGVGKGLGKSRTPEVVLPTRRASGSKIVEFAVEVETIPDTPDGKQPVTSGPADAGSPFRDLPSQQAGNLSSSEDQFPQTTQDQSDSLDSTPVPLDKYPLNPLVTPTAGAVRGKKRQVADGLGPLAKRSRHSNEPKKKMVVEIPSKKVLQILQDDDSDEEWGFLKGFG